MPEANTAHSIAFRCDGDAELGAGHVGRCLPIADQFHRQGWRTAFVGSYEGLPMELIEQAGHAIIAPSARAPCGVNGDYGAAILDCYGLGKQEIVALARTRPVATLGEGTACPDAAVHVDFHADRLGDRETVHLLPGPRFVPVDPRFRREHRETDVVRRILLTLGGGTLALGLRSLVAARVASRFPAAEIVIMPGPDGRPGQPLHERIVDVDVAVCGAGFTAYELATAGIPCLMIQVAENQARVVRGMTQHGLALAVDGREALGLELEDGLTQLASAECRLELAWRTQAVFDGRGAERVVDALISRGFGSSYSPADGSHR